MRFQSAKQARIYREMREARQAFLWEMARCAICGSHGDGEFGLSVHEILNGQHRMRAFQSRAAWLATCSDCNCNKLTDKKLWPLARQLAVKLDVDPCFFDLNEIRKLVAVEGAKVLPVIVTGDEVLVEFVKLKIANRPAA